MTIEITRTVAIESPFEGGTDREGENLDYARRCMADALRRGEAPYLSHALYPSVLDDTIYAERERGIRSGHAIAARLDAWVFYLDRGITHGMLAGVDAAVEAGFRPYHRPAGGNLCVYGPYEKPILFRTFNEDLGDRTCYGYLDGKRSEAGTLMLHECVRWPLLLAKFEEHGTTRVGSAMSKDDDVQILSMADRRMLDHYKVLVDKNRELEQKIKDLEENPPPTEKIVEELRECLAKALVKQINDGARADTLQRELASVQDLRADSGSLLRRHIIEALRLARIALDDDTIVSIEVAVQRLSHRINELRMERLGASGSGPPVELPDGWCRTDTGCAGEGGFTVDALGSHIRFGSVGGGISVPTVVVRHVLTPAIGVATPACTCPDGFDGGRGWSTDCAVHGGERDAMYPGAPAPDERLEPVCSGCAMQFVRRQNCPVHDPEVKLTSEENPGPPLERRVLDALYDSGWFDARRCATLDELRATIAPDEIHELETDVDALLGYARAPADPPEESRVPEVEILRRALRNTRDMLRHGPFGDSIPRACYVESVVGMIDAALGVEIGTGTLICERCGKTLTSSTVAVIDNFCRNGCNDERAPTAKRTTGGPAPGFRVCDGLVETDHPEGTGICIREATDVVTDAESWVIWEREHSTARPPTRGEPDQFGEPRTLHLQWNGTEWVDSRCGCRYHPDDDSGSHGGAPHVHFCARHAVPTAPAQDEPRDESEGFSIPVRAMGICGAFKPGRVCCKLDHPHEGRAHDFGPEHIAARPEPARGEPRDESPGLRVDIERLIAFWSKDDHGCFAGETYAVRILQDVLLCNPEHVAARPEPAGERGAYVDLNDDEVARLEALLANPPAANPKLRALFAKHRAPAEPSEVERELEAAEEESSRQRDRAKAAERERDAHRTAANTAESQVAVLREVLVPIVREMGIAVSIVRERTPHLPAQIEAAAAVERWANRIRAAIAATIDE